MIVEDLGVITPPVARLRDELGLPGMAVLQCAFGGGPDNPHRLENITERLVVYTGTHDLDAGARLVARARARRAGAATGLDPAEPHWSLIELAFGSRAAIAIVQAQDVLGLGSEARMNTPGHDERQLALAARAGRPHPRARPRGCGR